VSAVQDPVRDFAVRLEYVSGRVVLGVRGEVDVLTAPELGAVFDAVIGRGHRSIVVDLAECDFIDASGLRVLATAANLLSQPGAVFKIRSPSAMVRRIFDITGLAGLAEQPRPEHLGLVPLERPEPSSGRLGPEEAVALPEVLVGSGAGGTRQYLRRVSALPSDDGVFDGALRLVVALAWAAVGGADGVSVSLRRRGLLATVAASDQTIRDMDADQYATGEGPCVDASVEGRWFHVESLSSETRWPSFIPRARALGIKAILSSPLLVRNRPVGALNIYSRTAGAFAPRDQKLASVFASEASIALTDAGLDPGGDEPAGRPVHALRARQTIAVAQGVIMERDGVGEDSAYTSLRRSSVGTGRPLLVQAEDVVASTRWPPRDRGPRPVEGGQDG
jgi:anti-anti-sigma factor